MDDQMDDQMENANFINITINDHILTVGLNRPDKKNAINHGMYDDMRAALIEADNNNDVNVILIHGLEDSFTVGNDLADFNERDPNELSAGGKFLLTLHDTRKPIIAAVSGFAVGIGTTLLLHCDLVYAGENARFRLPFVNLGICPEAGSTLSLPAQAGHRAASDLLLFGDFFDVEKAISAGFVNQSVPTETLIPFSLAKATELASKPRQAVIETKHLLKQNQSEALKQRILDELDIFETLLRSDESKEARKAALHKK